MAIKPITNDNAGYESRTNRESQTSIRSEKGNPKVVIKKPGGQNAGKGFSIGLKEIDTAVIKHIRNIMKPKVREQNETISVPVLYGNEERWRSIRSRGALRDKNNSLMLPLIILKRTDTNFTDSMPYSFDHDVTGQFTSMVRAKKWSSKNRYDRFGIQHGKTPIYDTILTGMPDFVTCTYQIVMMTSYIEQMNYLTELIIEHENTYWGDTNSYKFLSALEGSFADATEMEVAGERLVKTEFGISMKGYVTPRFANSTTGPGANIQKARSIGKVTFGTETEVDISKK